jgi:NADH dehydrogenase [ubiquinone] 1 alpha subcomplex assembly factor 7
VTALRDELKAIIALEGPIPVARYMALCLSHPAHGYYATRDPLGAAGDFTTAPEISQMFGEMIGLWVADIWERMGAPQPLRLVELGPGRGTLMTDALRAARVRPAFLQAMTVHLVETSPALRARQQKRLQGVAPVQWHDRVGEVPDGPAIIVANEFFDALPVRQYVRTESGWRERLVGLGGDGELAFGLAPDPEPRLARQAHPGAVLERPVLALKVMGELAARLAAQGGAGLFIDYGYEGPAVGDTLQSVRRHAFADPLAFPGDADLTTHVDFAALARAAQDAGAVPFGPVPQGDFLRTLGIEARADMLKRQATPAQAEAIDTALQRLTGGEREAMGALFKALAVTDRSLLALPGFASVGASRTPEPIATGS